jgi:pantoate--beta-alanine ligase
MKIVHTIWEVKQQVTEWKQQGLSVGFVPTMGALHAGHISLVTKSASENDKTAVSIFVNPTQFSPTEDLEAYPRDMDTDSKLCVNAGVDLIFNPSASEMYPKDFCTYIDMDDITNELCGRSRPTHFRGVCTVVNKLFNVVTPTRAYFGQKDAQQLAVIKKMVTDLSMNIEVVGCPIVREDDGLAMSSRNAYLNPAERAAALILSQALHTGEQLVSNGERSSQKIISAIRNVIETQPLAKIDYVEVVDNNTMQKVNTIDGQTLVAIAVFIGKTRLIDNVIIDIQEL